MKQHWDALDVIALRTFAGFALICLAGIFIEWRLTRRPKLHRAFTGPKQADVDALAQRRFDTAIARNHMAQRAANRMEHWHRGEPCNVIPIRRRAK